MGLSRNKVAVPEGAAGTPPFWSFAFSFGSNVVNTFIWVQFRHLPFLVLLTVLFYGGLAQLARALAWHARGHRFDPDILHVLVIFDILTQARL